MITYIICLLLLAVLAAEDIREKKVSVKMILIAGFCGVLYRMVFGQLYWKEIIVDVLPGAALILLSFLTDESIGYGDGTLVMVLGLWLGGWVALMVTGIGIILSGIYGIFCLLKGKKDSFPFVPFLLLGMEVTLIYA